MNIEALDRSSNWTAFSHCSCTSCVMANDYSQLVRCNILTPEQHANSPLSLSLPIHQPAALTLLRNEDPPRPGSETYCYCG